MALGYDIPNFCEALTVRRQDCNGIYNLPALRSNMANLARSGAKSSSPPCKKKNQVPQKRSERAGREKREEEIDQER